MAPSVGGLQPRSAEEVAAARANAAQQRRRHEALLRQKAARQDAVAYARQLALDALAVDDTRHVAAAAAAGDDVAHVAPAASAPLTPPVADGGDNDDDDTMHVDSAATGRPRKRTSGPTHAAANALMLPEWLLDVPPDLATSWLVAPRPEGTRCVVVACRGATDAWRRDGSALAWRFASPLPAGSNATAEAVDSVTILDCILHEADNTLYIVDAMCWRGYNMYDCSTDFRQYWLHTKLGEYAPIAAAAHAPPSGWRYRFEPLHFVPADPAGVLAAARRGVSPSPHHAASGGVPCPSPPPQCFTPDGVLFVHREALYTPGGSTPLALTWKDGGCSRFVVDTDASGVATAVQVIVLALSPDGDMLLTDDDPPVALSTLGACVCGAEVVAGTAAAAAGATVADALAARAFAPPPGGSLLRLAAPAGCIRLDADAGCRVAAPLTVVGLAAHGRRGRPDSVSKIAFQAAARAGTGVDLGMLLGGGAARTG